MLTNENELVIKNERNYLHRNTSQWEIFFLFEVFLQNSYQT